MNSLSLIDIKQWFGPSKLIQNYLLGTCTLDDTQKQGFHIQILNFISKLPRKPQKAKISKTSFFPKIWKSTLAISRTERIKTACTLVAQHLAMESSMRSNII